MLEYSPSIANYSHVFAENFLGQANRKTLILDSAESLARSRGYDGFSYADLEAVVGIRKASIHHHFSSKAELATALIKRYCEKFDELIAGIEQSERTGGARLQRLINAYEDALDGGDKLCLCVAFSAGNANLPPEVMQEIASFQEKSVAWLKDVFKLGADDFTILRVGNMVDEAHACLALLEGAQLVSRAERSTAPFMAATKLIRDRLV